MGRGKKWGRASLFIITLAFSLCGCQQGEDAGIQEMVAATEGPAGLWEDKWTAAIDGGKSIPVQMKCEISGSDNQPDSIVDVTSMEIDSNNKERIAKGAFGNEVYLFDAEHMCERDLRQRLSREEEVLKKGYNTLEYVQVSHPEAVKEYRKKTIAELKRRVDRAKKLLNTAPKEPVPAQDGEYDGNSYMGYIDDIAFRLEFTPRTRGNKAHKVSDYTWWRYWDTSTEASNIELLPVDIKGFAPEELQDAWEIMTDGLVMETSFLNVCDLSEEEAEEKAVDMLQRLGFTDMVKVSARDLVWMGVDMNDNSWDADSIADGYVFNFQTGVDGNVLDVFEDEIRNDLPYGKEEIQVQVNDKGIVKVIINYPIQVGSITPNVKLLELEDVKDMLQTQLPTYISMYVEGYEKSREEEPSINNFRGTYLQLLYGRINDPEDPRHFTYVPVWELTGYFDRVDMVKFYVNGIDGSYITLDFR